MKRLLPTLGKLNDLLEDEDLPTVSVLRPLTKDWCETYGTKTFAYFSCHNMVQRARVEDMLEAAGCVVNRRYCRKSGNCPTESPRIEVQVSYLRAKGWNE